MSTNTTQICSLQNNLRSFVPFLNHGCYYKTSFGMQWSLVSDVHHGGLDMALIAVNRPRIASAFQFLCSYACITGCRLLVNFCIAHWRWAYTRRRKIICWRCIDPRDCKHRCIVKTWHQHICIFQMSKASVLTLTQAIYLVLYSWPIVIAFWQGIGSAVKQRVRI